jgi:hypothetical protein
LAPEKGGRRRDRLEFLTKESDKDGDGEALLCERADYLIGPAV